MCKYCKMELLDENLGERCNNNKVIMEIKDGSQIIKTNLYRCVTDDGSENCNILILDLDVQLPSGVYSVKSKEISIKYCPFCGEKL